MKNDARLLSSNLLISNLNTMKLSNSNNAIHLLSDKDKTPIWESIDPRNSDKMRTFIETFPAMKPLFRERIQYLCKPFVDSYSSGSEKLKPILQGLFIKQSGTFIYPCIGNASNTIFYSLEATYDEKIMIKDGRIFIFSNEKNAPDPSLVFSSIIRDNNATTLINRHLFSDNGGDPFQNVLSNTIGLILFTKYCPIETKIVVAGAKSIHNNERYVNQTKLPIEILDSTWFTTLVRSEGFTVGKEFGGFFRWQACGPELSERKLTWIFPFEKKGYTRMAKVLKDETNRGNNDLNEKAS